MCCYNIWRRRHHTYMHTAYEKREWVSIHCWLAFVYSLYSLYARCSMPMLLATGCWLASYVVSYNCPLSFHRQHVSVCVCVRASVWAMCFTTVEWWWHGGGCSRVIHQLLMPFISIAHALSLSHTLSYLPISLSLTHSFARLSVQLFASYSFACSLARSSARLLVVCTRVSE